MEEVLQYTTTWVNFEDIMLSKISQSQKDKYCVVPLIYEVLRVVKIIETESRMAWQGGIGGVTVQWIQTFSFIR